MSFDDCSNASAERALLGVLQSHRDELKMRLEESSTEWGFEDPRYRFYHQSRFFSCTVCADHRAHGASQPPQHLNSLPLPQG